MHALKRGSDKYIRVGKQKYPFFAVTIDLTGDSTELEETDRDIIVISSIRYRGIK